MTQIRARNDAGYEAPIGLAADPVIFTVRNGELCVLLARRSEEPKAGTWALPGGFVGADPDNPESPADTALRKLQERTGMGPSKVYLEQLATYADPDRDPRGWLPSIAYLALVSEAQLPAETKGVAWHPVDRLPKLAFDHAKIVADGVERLRGKLWYSNVAVGLLPRKFTMSQARKVYEAVAGQSYNPANFKRDLKASGLIEDTGEISDGHVGRPGPLYRFISRKPTWGAGYGKKTRLAR